MATDLVINKGNFVSFKTTSITHEYTLGKTLGEGAFGAVRTGVHKPTKQTRAIKILKRAEQDEKKLRLEVDILTKLTHPNIMQIYECYEDKANFYIITEICQGGELFEAISNKGSFSEADASKIIKQILSAICYAHKNNIVHRDLKPENVLLDDKKSESIIKIIDWGGATYFDNKTKLTSVDGTAYYIAPEVLSGKYDQKCDIWSIGVILYILLCGYPPFNGDTDDEIMINVKKGQYDFPKEEWEIISPQGKDLISKMLTVNPEKRLSALECMEHPWFAKFKNAPASTTSIAKNALKNMGKFKRNRKLEQAAISFIVNQLVSKDERKELMKQFQDWDTNGDGVLSRDEVIEGYRKAYGTVNVQEIDNMMESIDLDGNGVIDYNEFLNCTVNRDKIMSKENLEFAFKAFDTDGSGSITIEELSMIFNKNAANIDRSVFEQMIKEADENGDGEISFDEFKTIMTHFFS